jgi:hypothetical protein
MESCLKSLVWTLFENCLFVFPWLLGRRDRLEEAYLKVITGYSRVVGFWVTFIFYFAPLTFYRFFPLVLNCFDNAEKSVQEIPVNLVGENSISKVMKLLRIL